MLDDVYWRAIVRHVRLVVDDECALTTDVQHVQAAMEEDAVVLEYERPLAGCARERGDACGQLETSSTPRSARESPSSSS